MSPYQVHTSLDQFELFLFRYFLVVFYYLSQFDQQLGGLYDLLLFGLFFVEDVEDESC